MSANEPDWLQKSQLAPHFEGLAAWLHEFLPEQFAEISTLVPTAETTPEPTPAASPETTHGAPSS
jgi:uncharacterized membrane protein required for colicin V production